MKLTRNAYGYQDIMTGRNYSVDLAGQPGPAMKTSGGGAS